jgi:uncharacterized membrane protein
MKTLRISATLTDVFGFLSLIALVFMYLALSDISKEPDTILEWKVVQFCWITLLLFTISAFFTVGIIIKIPGLRKNIPID